MPSAPISELPPKEDKVDYFLIGAQGVLTQLHTRPAQAKEDRLPMKREELYEHASPRRAQSLLRRMKHPVQCATLIAPY